MTTGSLCSVTIPSLVSNISIIYKSDQLVQQVRDRSHRVCYQLFSAHHEKCDNPILLQQQGILSFICCPLCVPHKFFRPCLNEQKRFSLIFIVFFTKYLPFRLFKSRNDEQKDKGCLRFFEIQWHNPNSLKILCLDCWRNK